MKSWTWLQRPVTAALRGVQGAETGRSWELVNQPASPNGKTLSQNSKVESDVTEEHLAVQGSKAFSEAPVRGQREPSSVSLPMSRLGKVQSGSGGQGLRSQGFGS